jgi:hypothetical protein
MPTAANEDRRRQPRFDGSGFRAEVRIKGQFSRMPGEVLDFNRHGVAIELDRPLPKDQLVFVSLDHGDISLPRVIGVVHNCLCRASGYRCGILFRTQSDLQFDKVQVESALAQMEGQVVEDRGAEDRAAEG